MDRTQAYRNARAATSVAQAEVDAYGTLSDETLLWWLTELEPVLDDIVPMVDEILNPWMKAGT